MYIGAQAARRPPEANRRGPNPEDELLDKTIDILFI